MNTESSFWISLLLICATFGSIGLDSAHNQILTAIVCRLTTNLQVILAVTNPKVIRYRQTCSSNIFEGDLKNMVSADTTDRNIGINGDKIDVPFDCNRSLL